MSKTVSDELFQLIKSLNRSEKGYLKKWLSFSAATGKGKMLQLYNLIDKQKEYNELKLKKQGNYSSHQIANLKRILYLNLLNGLNDYHAANSITKQLRQLLNYTEDLFERELYTQSQKILRKAKLLAYQYEERLYLLEILGWERNIIRNK